MTIVCSDCTFYYAATAGSDYDRCKNPLCFASDEDDATHIRRGTNPRCVHARGYLTFTERGSITVTCGKDAKFFQPKMEKSP